MIKNTIIVCLVLICCSIINGNHDSNDCKSIQYISGKTNGDIAVKGKLNDTMTCIWNISVDTSKGLLTTVFLKELYLDDADSVVIYLSNGSEYGPFHGSMGSFVLFIEEAEFILNLTTSSTKMIRKFDGYFSDECNLPVDDIPIVASPYYKVRERMLTCIYRFSKPLDKSRSLVFDKFHLSEKSNLEVHGSDGLDKVYTNTPPDIFGKDMLTLTINLDLSNNESVFTIYNRAVNMGCIKYYLAEEGSVVILKSIPRFKIVNDSVPHECRWLIKSDKSPTLGIVFDKVEFSSVLDTLVLNDGPSELSSPLAIVAQANQNTTKGGGVIRTSGPYLWVSFRSLDFSSNFSGNVSVHGQGGYHRGSGSIMMKSTTGNDTIFLLEVDANENVLLNITSSNFKSPASLTVYENFNIESNYLAQFHGDMWAPIVSKTSRMMLVASGFSTGTFSADFRGIKPGCMHTSPPSSDSYILSGNCNSSCVWMVPPQNTSGNVVLLQFQFLSLSDTDELQIIRLDAKQSLVATIGSNITQVPQISLRADEGFYVDVTRGDCPKRQNDIILIAHTTYPPACSKNYTLKPTAQVQIASPSYPDTYPLLSECQWNIDTSSESNLLHLAFNKLQLASNHCINITQTIFGQKTSVMQSFSGDQLPDDLLNGAAIIQFDSVNCHRPSDKLSLVSSEGFSLNVTSADCGLIINKTTGEIYTEGYPNLFNKSNLCIWKIQVPAKVKEANYIIFHVDTKGNLDNHELRIFDGASVRDAEIKNTTDKEIWSRNYTVLFMYKRLNSSRPSAAINITYRTMSCNSSFQCKNGICIHPDWRCNGVNDCGDNTDEIECATVPVPEPDKKTTIEGIAPVTYGVSIVCFFILGIVATLGVPYLIQRYRNGRYHQFRDLSEGN